MKINEVVIVEGKYDKITLENILDAIAILYFLILMTIGLIKIHDFSMGRLIGTSVLSLAGVAAIVFLVITIVILVQQFGGFIVTVVTEILTL
jgi:hypothetical protein